MKVVIDTNCLLVSIPRQARHRWFFDALRAGYFEVVVSTEILAEYAEKVSDFYAPTVSENVLKLLIDLPRLVLTDVFFRWNLLQDPDDNKFVDAYVSANADYLITYDRGFRTLWQRTFPRVMCLTLDEFKPILDNVRER